MIIITKRLQVFINDKWKYVFCRNDSIAQPIITDDRLKAIKGDENSLKYFQNTYSEHKFRIAN